MVKIAVIIFHSDQWNERQCYVDYKTNCVFVDGMMLFDFFVNLIRTQTQMTILNLLLLTLHSNVLYFLD